MPRQPTAECTIVAPQPQRPITTAAAATNDWEQWLQRQFEPLHRALGQLLAEERRKFGDQLERKTSPFEIKLAKLAGAIDVLRGAQPPPPAKFPKVKAWSADTIYHEGDIVTFAGGCWQAAKDTACAPGAKDWVCLAVSGETIVGPSGSSLTIRGTYDGDEAYKHLDV